MTALAAAGEQGFVLTPEASDLVSRQHLLAAQVLSNLSGRPSYLVYSGTAEGKSNANSSYDSPYPYDYSYQVRVTATQIQAMLDFVFDHPEGRPTPWPVRVTVDESGNVSTTFLSAEEAERVRVDTVETHSR